MICYVCLEMHLCFQMSPCILLRLVNQKDELFCHHKEIKDETHDHRYRPVLVSVGKSHGRVVIYYLYLPNMCMAFYYPVTRHGSLSLDPVGPGI